MAETSDNTLRLLIQLGVIGQKDAEAVNSLLKETAATAKETGKAMSESVPESWAGWDKYKKAIGGANEGHGELKEGLHQLRGAAKMAGPEFAELGHLLHAAFNPVALATAALAGGLEAYFKWQEKVEERHRQMILDLQQINDQQRAMIAAGPTATENWIAITKTVAEARAHIGGLAEEMKRFEERSKNFDLAATDAQKARIEGRERELTLIEEQLKLLEAVGAITKEQSDLRAGEVEHQKKVEAIAADIAQKKLALDQAKNNYEEELRRAGGAAAVGPDALGPKQAAAQAADEALRRAEALVKDTPGQIKFLEEKIREWTKGQKDHPMEWNTFAEQINNARHQISVLESERKTANTNLPTLAAEAERAREAFETTKGLADKFEAMQSAITGLTQQLLDANGAAPSKLADENQRFALDQFQRILKDTGLKPNDIIAQGAAADDDLRRLWQMGYNRPKIENEGENALREKSAGHGYDQGAISRLERMNSDLRAHDRLNALLVSMGQNNQGMLQLIAVHQAGQTTLAQEIQTLKNNYAAILRWAAQQRPAN